MTTYPVGTVVEVIGATYPVRYEYDTAGRRTALLTTRDGVSWDRTSWAYDPATGLCLRKNYADGTFETYSYTDDGLLATTTRPGGQTLANVYDVNRKLVRTSSNDGVLDYVYARDEYGRIVTASNAVARTARVLHNGGVATNETWAVGTNVSVITRSVDSVGRLNGLAISDTGYAQHFDYTSDNLSGTISNTDAVVAYTYAADRSETGYAMLLGNGMTFTRLVTRDAHRPELVTSITNVFGSTVRGLVYTYDGLSRPISRNDDSFGYNGRGEVAEAIINGNVETHAYDSIGNSVIAAFQSVTNTYAANALNQYTSVVGETTCAPTYNANGDLLTFGVWSFTYDDDSRLLTVSSNSVLLVTNAYDCQGRRVRKTTPEAVTTFLYDDRNLIRETVTYATGCVDALEYFWGRDLSGTLQGAGGVGGLLYVKRNGMVYIPFADVNGNITAYADSTGTLVAEYVYDAFGRIIAQAGSLADVFRHRFSSKYFDSESGLYYYGRRFYYPVLMRWINRDPIQEKGGLNLYGCCKNNQIMNVDTNGCAYVAYRRLDNVFNKITGVVWSQKKEIRNRVWAHQHIFFEDGKSPSNVGYFDNGLHDDGADNLKAKWIPTIVGLKDSCLRQAVYRVPPLTYSLFGDSSRDIEQYNCQDWVDEVLLMYNALRSGRTYYPKSTKFIGGR